jgi:hypothetical protein
MRKFPSFISKLDAWAWACISATLITASLRPDFGPHLSNDAFQYLSVAQNTLAGHFGDTSLIHFDSERSFGVTPAPMVHFPLGYPLAIALVGLFGIPLENAALLVSAVSVAACVPLLAWIAGQLGAPRLLRNVVLAAFVFNALVIRFGASALSEALFTFLVLLGAALLVAARLHTHRPGRWALAGLAFGAAYWVRYAGLFFILGLGLLVVWHFVASDRLRAKGYAAAVTAAGAALLAGFLRNILLVGNWRGFTEKKISHPLSPMFAETVRAGKLLFLGPNFDMPAWTAIVRALFIASFFGGTTWLTWSYLRHRAAQAARAVVPTGMAVDLLVLVLIYCGCMFYVGLVSTIGYEVRMFVPLMPLLLLLLAGALQTTLATPTPQGISRKLAVLALTASFCCYLILNLVMFVRPPTDYERPPVAQIMDSRSADGKTARQAVLELVDPARVLVANNGQAFGYALRRPTVSLVSPANSAVDWNEKTLENVVRHYHAAAIVIDVHDVFMPSPFVRQLAQGEAPSWMKLAYRSSDVLVYEPLSGTAKSKESLQVSQ